MTERKPYRPLLAGVSGALGVLIGGFVGIYVGLWLGVQPLDPPGSEDAVSRMLEALAALVEAIPSIYLGAFLGAVLGWLVLPTLVGSVMKWPKLWLAFGVQVLAGIVLWLTAVIIGSILDFGAIGGWIFVVLVIMGTPATGQWFVERSLPRSVSTDDGPRPDRQFPSTEAAPSYTPPWTAAALTVLALLLARVGASLVFLDTVAAVGFIGAALFLAFLAARWSGYHRPAAMTLLAVAVLPAPGLIGAFGFAAIALRPVNRWAIVARLLLLIPMLIIMFADGRLHLFDAGIVLTPLLVVGIDWAAARLSPTSSRSNQQDSDVRPPQGQD